MNSRAEPGPPPAEAVERWAPVRVWSVEALDRFVCWMTYGRIFDRFDLLGAWIDAADRFSLVLADRSTDSDHVIGYTVTATDWPDLRAVVDSEALRLLDRLRAHADAIRSSPTGAMTRELITWNGQSRTRQLPWAQVPAPDDPPRHGFDSVGMTFSAREGPGPTEVPTAATDLQYRYRGRMWASTMAWRMIDGLRGGWSTNLRLLACWVTAPDEFVIIVHDTTTGHEELHRQELQTLLVPGQATPRVGILIRSNGRYVNPWDPAYLGPPLDELAEITAATPTCGLARDVAQGAATLRDGIVWIWNPAGRPTPDAPWAALYREVLDRAPDNGETPAG